MSGCESYQTAERRMLTRRAVVAGGLIGAAMWATRKTALAQTLVRSNGNVVVVIFLRGGADGLNIVVPYQESNYYSARPTLAVAADKVIKLDDQFGLNPDLAPLRPLYENGELAVMHAVGSRDTTRSHFEAMNAMERGAANDQGDETGGWIARHLLASNGASAPLRAVAFAPTMPESLSGATQALAIESLAEYRLPVPDDKRDRYQSALASLYDSHGDVFSEGARNTLSALTALRDYDPAKSKPEDGAVYPETYLGEALAQVAYLVRKDVGLEVACLDAADRGGWDTHIAQGALFTGLLDNLGRSLAAFRQDLGKEMSRVTVVVQTEFGRRVEENSSYGTDHGRGSVMFALGGGVNGGRVFARWPGLSKEILEGPGDLPVTTDYRDVLAEMLERRLGSTTVGDVFPGFERRPVGVFG
jgi:uncharacterized protein (DUF1501 family)